jgi:hypothetical protein
MVVEKVPEKKFGTTSTSIPEPKVKSTPERVDY